MNTLNVIAAPGIRFPVEGKWREVITEETAQTVPDSPYYRRALVDGDLLEAPSASQASQKPAKK